MDRNFFITGAAQGIGLQFTRCALLGNGRVVMADIAKEAGEKTKEKLEKEFGTGKVCFIHLDVRNEEMWKSAWDEAERFFGGQVEVLMNNAGVLSKTNWKMMLDVNLVGLVTGTMLAMERMGVSRGGQGGVIFQTASVASLLHGCMLHGTAEEEIYTTTKWAVLGLTRSMGKQEIWVKDKVKVVAVCPAMVKTNLIESYLCSMGDAEKRRGCEERLIEPEEVARAMQQAIVGGETGDVITVGPGMVYYYPDIQMMVFLLYKVIHTMLVTVGRIPRTQAVTTRQIGFVLGLLILGLGLLFHLLLNCLGL